MSEPTYPYQQDPGLAQAGYPTEQAVYAVGGQAQCASVYGQYIMPGQVAYVTPPTVAYRAQSSTPAEIAAAEYEDTEVYESEQAAAAYPPRRIRRWPRRVALLVAGALVLGGCDVVANNSDGMKFLSGGLIGPQFSKPSRRSDTALNQSPSTATKKSSKSAAAEAPVVVFDPAFSGHDKVVMSTVELDGETYTLRDRDFPTTTPELNENFDIATCASQSVSKYGLTSLLTKKEATGYQSLIGRAKMATAMKADLFLTIRADHTSGQGQLVYDQRGLQHNGSYGTMFRRDSSGRVMTFKDSTRAKRSQKFANLLGSAVASSRGQTSIPAEADLGTGTYNGKTLPNGNLWTVDATTEATGVYLVAGVREGNDPNAPMTIAHETAYAFGIVRGVEAALPVSGAQKLSDSALRKALFSCLSVQATKRPVEKRPTS